LKLILSFVPVLRQAKHEPTCPTPDPLVGIPRA
jgi:hypothetical protein